MSDPCFRTASELARAIRDGEISSREVMGAHLERIARLNTELNAIVTLDEDGAMRGADEADSAIARGQTTGPLHGVPFTVKDVLDTAGLRTTAGHPPMKDRVPAEDATVVARLRAAGAVLLGKTNTPALAMDIQCDNPLFGPTRNPWSPDRTPGGSSGGEAAAIAAGMTPLGVGSDIGGSVRIPAHYCGVFGLKPGERRVPMTGHVLPGDVMAVRHLATCGPMARSVEDLRLALGILAGPDGRDHDVAPVPLGDAAARPVESLRLAWMDDLGGLPVTADTRAALERLAQDLARAGCRIERTRPEGFEPGRAWETYGELFGIMGFANAPLPSRLAVRTLGRFMVKDAISRAGARRALASPRDYFAALERRDGLARALDGFLDEHDAWLLPVSSSPAFPHRKTGDIHHPVDVDGEEVPGNLAGTGYTCPFNLTGHPAVAVPLGTSGDGLPIGVQVVGRRWGEMALLDVAEALTGITGAFRRPPGS